MDIFEKNAWNDAWNKVLNRLGIRKVPGGTVNYLGNVLSTIETDLAKAGATTAAMTLYVDAATGLDTNTGLVSAPLKTIQAAINRTPHIIAHRTTIYVRAGTYAEDLVVSNHIRHTGWFTISGYDWTDVVPTTGLATGTIASHTNRTVNVTAAGWTVNDLRGKYIQITSGSKLGYKYPIESNTAAALTVGGYGITNITGATFKFVTQGAIITGNATGDYDPMIHVGSVCDYFFNAVQFDNISFQSRANKWYGIYSYSGSTIFKNCNFKPCEWQTMFTLYNPVSFFSIQRSFVDATSANSASYYFANPGEMYVYESVIRGGWGFLGEGAVGVFLNSALTASSESMFDIDKFVDLYVKDCLVDTCTAGIKIIGHNNRIYLDGTTNITNSSGWGISQTTKGSYNSIQIGTSVLMTVNASGDLTPDGTTAISIADLRADPDKTVVDLLRLNRIAAD
jgi:hypothetical protein